MLNKQCDYLSIYHLYLNKQCDYKPASKANGFAGWYLWKARGCPRTYLRLLHVHLSDNSSP